jgi:hypothetical protein
MKKIVSGLDGADLKRASDEGEKQKTVRKLSIVASPTSSCRLEGNIPGLQVSSSGGR